MSFVAVGVFAHAYVSLCARIYAQISSSVAYLLTLCICLISRLDAAVLVIPRWDTRSFSLDMGILAVEDEEDNEGEDDEGSGGTCLYLAMASSVSAQRKKRSSEIKGSRMGSPKVPSLWAKAVVGPGVGSSAEDDGDKDEDARAAVAPCIAVGSSFGGEFVKGFVRTRGRPLEGETTCFPKQTFTFCGSYTVLLHRRSARTWKRERGRKKCID